MQALTTHLDDKFAGAVQELEKMRLAGVKSDQNAQEQMQKVEEKSAQTNEARRTSMEAINQKTEAVYAEATRQANATGQRLGVEVD